MATGCTTTCKLALASDRFFAAERATNDVPPISEFRRSLWRLITPSGKITSGQRLAVEPLAIDAEGPGSPKQESLQPSLHKEVGAGHDERQRPRLPAHFRHDVGIAGPAMIGGQQNSMSRGQRLAQVLSSLNLDSFDAVFPA